MSPLMSMTGFGRAESASPLGTCVVEVKSVNHRFLESRIYLPREMSSLEIPLTRRLKERLSRGKVDVSVRWTPSPLATAQLRFNEALLKEYAERVRAVGEAVGIARPVPIEYLLSLPGVTENTAPNLDEEQLAALAGKALDAALDALSAERRREGQALNDEIGQRLDALDALHRKVNAGRDEAAAALRERLEKKIEEWAQDSRITLEPGRIEAEIMLLVDKSDVTEEIVRLATHIEAFRAILAAAALAPELPPDSRGKPMEFLTQELLRETNTVSSKVRQTDTVTHVLAMKNEIEKIREQVLNVE